MTNQTTIAVLGAGRWGNHLVRNFHQHPQARLLAVVDPNSERLAAVQERYNLDARVTLTSDWQSVLPQVEAVAIATPASTHYSLIKAALEQNCHVLAEKPLTLDNNECRSLCHLADQLQLQLVVDHTYLFNPAVVRGKEVVSSGCLGELRYGYAARTNLGPVRQDVDAMWDLAIHDITIFNSWLGEIPVRVRAWGTTWLQAGLADVVWVILTYPSGFQATIHVSWSNPDKQRRLGVVGSQGSLIFDEMLTETPLRIEYGSFAQKGDRFMPVDVRREVVQVEAAEPLGKVCDHFLACVHANRRSDISSGQVGAQLVAILRAIAESLNQQGQPIEISDC
ncbi:MAG: Gfo/Idh/MocA family oxidoreductase [Hormoscilla sp. GM7CHS1pb]|nr:Gfo/Idh/MocA family oxidoreductase [Hormoscilla sp. GM7CHS1pb]